MLKGFKNYYTESIRNAFIVKTYKSQGMTKSGKLNFRKNNRNNKNNKKNKLLLLSNEKDLLCSSILEL